MWTVIIWIAIIVGLVLGGLVWVAVIAEEKEKAENKAKAEAQAARRADAERKRQRRRQREIDLKILSLTCMRCNKLAEPTVGTRNRYRCAKCGNQFAGAPHNLMQGVK